MSIRKPDMSPDKVKMPMLEITERIHNFEEVALGYTSEQAMKEAERCMNCPERYCSKHCPMQTDIPGFISEIRAGNFEEAYRRIIHTNPLPCISGRVCPTQHQCESHCTRGIKSEPVAIGRLERFVADRNEEQGGSWSNIVPALDARIAIVGSGPAAITCAHFLAKTGLDVTIYDSNSRLGGALAWGIPSFVLPKSLVDSQFNRLSEAGVHFKTGMTLGKDISLKELRNEYDAVFIATGTGKPVGLNVEGSKIPGVLQAVDYLSGETNVQGKDVVVIGGGNTAIDVARTAIRSGAKTVRLIYRRSIDEMPATQEEIVLSKDEGIEFVFLTNPVCFLEKEGNLSYMECQKMQFTNPDYPGGRKNVCPTGEIIRLETNQAILAIGFKPDLIDGLRLDSQNRIIVDENYETSMKGVFAGGDAVTGTSTVMKAAEFGKDAAAAIIKFFDSK